MQGEMEGMGSDDRDWIEPGKTYKQQVLHAFDQIPARGAIKHGTQCISEAQLVARVIQLAYGYELDTSIWSV